MYNTFTANITYRTCKRNEGLDREARETVLIRELAPSTRPLGHAVLNGYKEDIT